jgi:hypothetical protein
VRLQRTVDDPGQHRGRQQRLAPGRPAHRLHQILRGTVLDQIADRTGPERAVDVGVVGEGGEHQHPGRRMLVEDPPGGLHAVHPRHPQVHQDHVRAQPFGQPDRLATVARLADDVEPAGGLQQQRDARAHQGLIVHHQYPDHRPDRPARSDSTVRAPVFSRIGR